MSTLIKLVDSLPKDWRMAEKNVPKYLSGRGVPESEYSISGEPDRVLNREDLRKSVVVKSAVVATGVGAASTTSEDSEAGVITAVVKNATSKPALTTAKHVVRSSSADRVTSASSSAIPDRPKYIETILDRENREKLRVPIGLALKVDRALTSGAPPDELESFLVDKEGVTSAQASGVVNQALRSKVIRAFESPRPPMAQELAEFLRDTQKLDSDRINKVLPDNSYLSSYWKAAGEVAVDTFAAMNSPTTPEQVVSRAKNIRMKYSTTVKEIGGNFSEELQRDAASDLLANNQYIVQTLASNGIEGRVTNEGEIEYERDGEWLLAETSFVDEMFAGRNELAFGLAAGITASRVPGPWFLKASAATAASAGAVMLGRGQDVVRNALQTNAEISDRLVWEQMKDAGLADLATGTLGSSVFKIGSGALKGLYNTLDTFIGNKEGAFTALKTQYNLTNSEAREWVAKWEKVSEAKAPGVRLASKAIAVIPRIHPDSSELVAKAMTTNTDAGPNIANEVSKRAKDVIKQVSSGAVSNIGEVLNSELPDYVKLVKDNYGSVKNEASVLMEGKDYRFDFVSLAIDPLKEIPLTLTNDNMKKSALNYLELIRVVGGKKKTLTNMTDEVAESIAEEVDVPELRTFDNLLELNVLVNRFSRQRFVKASLAPAKKIINEAQTNIRAEIRKAAKDNMENPDKWLSKWEEANIEYKKMVNVEVDTLTKAILRGGVENSDVLRTLMKRSKAIDSTFRDVIQALPDKLVPTVESTVVKGFVDKYTSGDALGAQVIDFPTLAKELSDVTLTTAKAKNDKRVITELASVLRADDSLAAVSGTVTLEGVKQIMANDAITKAQYSIATGIFSYTQRFMPTQKGRMRALAIHLGNALAEPAHSKNVTNILGSLGKDKDFENELKAKFLTLAKFGKESTFPNIPVYSNGNEVSKGKLGKGKYYNLDKGSTKRLIDPRRVADEYLLGELVGVNKLTAAMYSELTDTKKKIIEDKLKGQGKIGITLDGNIMLF